MAESAPRTPGRHSVFVKLVAVMLVTTACLLVLVVIFFSLIVGQKTIHPIYHLFVDYADRLAVSGIDLATAEKIAARLDVEIRYEGPGGTWATAEELPPLGEVAEPGYSRRWGYLYPAAAADGGHYLVAWAYPRRLSAVHDQLVALLCLFIAAVVLATYLVLRRLLRPLRRLGDGVARLGDGELDVVVPVTTRDELGTLSDAFNRMVRRVGEMIRARDRLLLDISHELRSPLTRLKVALELLPDGREKARMAADVDEMGAMVAELLELERLRDGAAPRRERQELVPLLHEIATSFRERAPGIEVDAPTSLVAEIDAEGLRRVLGNLLENAIKYSLPDSRPIEIHAEDADGDVVIRVDDDGPGIPEADLPALFEPFFRVDRSRARSTGGYGLGLSICKRIVEAHGGTITAENRVPRGATFVVRLPRDWQAR